MTGRSSFQTTAWTRARLPDLPHNQRFDGAPDWVCEVLSPSTIDTDRKTESAAKRSTGLLMFVSPT